MATRRSITEGGVFQFFTRIPRPVAPDAAALNTVFIVPLYQNVRAFEETGDLVESARVDLDGSGGGSYTSAFPFNSQSVSAPLPGLRQGAVVDPAKTDIYLAFGSGAAATTNRLSSENDEQVLLDRSTLTSGVLGGPNAGNPELREFSDSFNLDFGIILAGLPVPGLGAARNPLANNLILVVFEGFEDKPAIVQALGSEAAPLTDNTLLIWADPRVPSGTYGYKIVILPRFFDVYPTGRSAFIYASDFDPSGSVLTDTGSEGAGTIEYENLDPNQDWDVEVVDPSPATDQDVTVVITPYTATPKVTISLGTDGGGALDPAKNTVDLVSEAVVAAFRDHYRPGWAPVRVVNLGTSANTFVAALASTTITGPVLGWDGRIVKKTVGADGNDIRVDLQVAVGADDPAKVEQFGDNVIITLGTTGGSYDPADNLVSDLNDLLTAANIDLEIVIDETTIPGTESLYPDGLADYFNHAGFVIIGYQRKPASASALTEFLVGGLDAGGVEIYGGLLPNTNETTVVSARAYAEYRALRVDASPSASSVTTGNRANLIEVTEFEVERLLGEVSPDNPAGLAANQYFAAAAGRRLFILSPAVVSSTYPWGTQQAMQDAWDFLLKRTPYHVYAFNDAPFMTEWGASVTEALGGTETEALVKPTRLYYPIKNFETEADLTIASGTDADRDAFDLSQATASIDFVASGVVAGDAVVFSGLEAEATAPLTLQSGDKAFEIATVNVGGDPFKVDFTTDLPVSVSNKAFTVFRPGETLTNTDGTYKSQEAAESLYDFHDQFVHPRLNKHLADAFETSVDGTFTLLDGVYMLAKFAGLIAKSPQHVPVNRVGYPEVRRVEGTSDIYNKDQLDLLTGGGIVVPIQRIAGEGPVIVRRDVSSDTSTRIFQRRTAGVAEDLLVIETERLIQPRLGPALVTEQVLDRVAIDITGLIDFFRERDVFRSIELVRIVAIDDEIRQDFGIDDTGVLVIYELAHLEEFTTAIINHIIRPQ